MNTGQRLPHSVSFDNMTDALRYYDVHATVLIMKPLVSHAIIDLYKINYLSLGPEKV